MKSFKLKKINKKLKTENFIDNLKGISYKPKNTGKFLELDIKIVNNEIIETLITQSFNRKYRKLLEKFLNETQNDDSEGNLIIILDELAKLKNILLKKYNKQLSKERLSLFFKQIKLLENEIRAKILNIRLINNQRNVHNKEETRCVGR